MMADDSRKTLVEIKRMPEIKTIEDVPEYLKLFLVKYPHALGTQGTNPSGMNIGHSNNNAEFLYVLNGQSNKDWEALKDKLDNKEITKKCEILCKKIRSLNSQKKPSLDGEEEEDNYDKVIFCVDAKAIKKFKKSRSKNMQRAPRRNRTRANMRVKTKLTRDVL